MSLKGSFIITPKPRPYTLPFLSKNRTFNGEEVMILQSKINEAPIGMGNSRVSVADAVTNFVPFATETSAAT